MSLLSLFTGRSRHEQAVTTLRPLADKVIALEQEMAGLTDSELKARVQTWRGKPLAELTPRVPAIFAAVREASGRVLKMKHFPVQVIGGLALLDNKITEMKTGEGKTLVATLPLVVHGLTGQGAHLVTVNDYLSERDAQWMGPLYNYFDLSVGVIGPNQSPAEKRQAYAADITYGTNNEFGFDYLRDNMATASELMTMRSLSYAIVDEVDSILIDEARTPLIISAPDTESTHLYQQFARLVPQLKENEHYNIDEKRRVATLTEEGVAQVEKMLGVSNLYAEGGVRMVHHIEQALRANALYQRDKEYVVQDGQVIIVDEFTGRLMVGRRYSEGLHQAIEAKERVPVQQESRTLATITFQNFFRLYPRLAGMTGTAVTSAEEFEKVYNLDVIAIPTNKQLIRQDLTDRIYMTEKAKYQACVAEIKHRHEQGQPVLVGTIAIEKSEHLSALLQQAGVVHEVLNAKHHAREAEIIARAGQQGAVTISTNMAGRGTDIKLGDNVASLGGLFVLGTERHEARRIDNQLRGRSGRQGDPGATQFLVSMEDDIMRVFGGPRLKGIMQRLKVPEDEPIENRMVSRSLERAQERVEGHYFDMRRQVLSYDDVLNRQRNAIYTLRRGVLIDGIWKEAGQDSVALDAHVQTLIAEQADITVMSHSSEGEAEHWDIEEMAESAHAVTGLPAAGLRNRLAEARASVLADGSATAREKLRTVLRQLFKEAWDRRAQELGAPNLLPLLRAASLRAIDMHWMNHLDTMDYLRTGIGLRGYGQRDPLVEYQKEGYRLFQELLATVKATIVEIIFKAEAVRAEEVQSEAKHISTTAPHRLADDATLPTAAQTRGPATATQLQNPYKNVGRNDPCPCGSGKKFKKCHGAVVA